MENHFFHSFFLLLSRTDCFGIFTSRNLVLRFSEHTLRLRLWHSDFSNMRSWCANFIPSWTPTCVFYTPQHTGNIREKTKTKTKSFFVLADVQIHIWIINGFKYDLWKKANLTISRETQTFEGRPRNLWLCLLRGLGLNGFREQAFLIDVLSSLWLKLSIRTASHFFSLSFNLLQHSFSHAISSSPWERERERRRRRRVGVEVEGAGCTI